MGAGRSLPAPPKGSEDDPTLQFTTANVSMPSGAGYGCYAAPNLPVGTALDPDLVLTCDPGYYCPNLMTNDSSTLPVFCPPSGSCMFYRLSSLACSVSVPISAAFAVWFSYTPSLQKAQGKYEPTICKAGNYCPDYKTRIVCPEGYFCPSGSVAPRPCEFLASCPKGSIMPTPHIALITMAIVDVAIFTLLLIIKIREGALRRIDFGRVVSQLTGGASYVLQQRAKEAITNAETEEAATAKAIKDSQHTVVRSDTIQRQQTVNELRRLVLAFHTALGNRDLRMNFKFDDLSLRLKNGKTVLQGVTGEIRSKRMTAIIGPSGAGKTTFMNVLMGKVPRTGGRLFINGAEAEVHLYRKIIGYVPQEDVMLRELTVREVVLHSARVRLPATWTKRQIEDHVDNVLKALNLTHVANSFIGDETDRGVSGGQRKRVNIGMELAAAPLAIFLDEPTSGLDATAALEVAEILQSIAHLGLTVVSVIHQPRIEIFRKFDDVLMIAPGGKVAYLGPVTQAQRYFETLGFHFDPEANASDVLMDILSGKARNDRYSFGPQQLVAAWENSKVREFLMEPNHEDDEFGMEEAFAYPSGVPSFVRASHVADDSTLNRSNSTLTNGAESVDQWLVTVQPAPGPEEEIGVITDRTMSDPLAEDPPVVPPPNFPPPHTDFGVIGGPARTWPRHMGSTRIASFQMGANDSGSGLSVPGSPNIHHLPVPRSPSISGSVSAGSVKRAPSHATIANSIIDSIGRGIRLGSQSGRSDEEGRQKDLEFHRLAPLVVKERGAGLVKQIIYCHNRSLVQQSRAAGALVLELFVALFAGMLMGLSAQGKIKEMFNGVYKGVYVVLSPAPFDIVSLYGLLLGIAVALAGAPSGVKVFGEEKTVFWREAASGHSRLGYYIGKTTATAYRLLISSLHFTATYVFLAKPAVSTREMYGLVLLQFWGVYGMACVISVIVRRENASLLAVVIGLFAAVFCGYGPSLVQAKSWGILWFYELSFNKWAAEAHYALNTSFYRLVYDVELSANIYGYSLGQVITDFVACMLLGVMWRVIGFVLMVSLNREKQR
ncbi:hypothetical protein HDU67_008137 [Dinochytrium kinnereticum]|nr:hypothetical protein HDU67_008137 [Dinochytrium kinnereticum]